MHGLFYESSLLSSNLKCLSSNAKSCLLQKRKNNRVNVSCFLLNPAKWLVGTWHRRKHQKFDKIALSMPSIGRRTNLLGCWWLGFTILVTSKYSCLIKRLCSSNADKRTMLDNVDIEAKGSLKQSGMKTLTAKYYYLDVELWDKSSSS